MDGAPIPAPALGSSASSSAWAMGRGNKGDGGRGDDPSQEGRQGLKPMVAAAARLAAVEAQGRERLLVKLSSHQLFLCDRGNRKQRAKPENPRYEGFFWGGAAKKFTVPDILRDLEWTFFSSKP